jgi:hypothetical protein
MYSTHAPRLSPGEIGDGEAVRLRRLNLVVGSLHLIQGAAMLALSNGISLPVTGTFGTGPPGQPLRPPVIEELFSYRLGPMVALFSLLSALFHFVVVSPLGRAPYLRELARGQNRFRWVEYSLSSSLMVVLVAGITGITDAAALVGIFGVNASMILFGWLMETKNRPGQLVDWSPFVFGCVAGIVPWLAVTIYLIGAGAEVPGFVYGIFVSLFLLFNCFAVNQWLQYRARGRWNDYLHGERVFIWLSLIAKSLLAWQIFANVLM